MSITRLTAYRNYQMVGNDDPASIEQVELVHADIDSDMVPCFCTSFSTAVLPNAAIAFVFQWYYEHQATLSSTMAEDCVQGLRLVVMCAQYGVQDLTVEEVTERNNIPYVPRPAV